MTAQLATGKSIGADSGTEEPGRDRIDMSRSEYWNHGLSGPKKQELPAWEGRDMKENTRGTYRWR